MITLYVTATDVAIDSASAKLTMLVAWTCHIYNSKGIFICNYQSIIRMGQAIMKLNSEDRYNLPGFDKLSCRAGGPLTPRAPVKIRTAS